MANDFIYGGTNGFGEASVVEWAWVGAEPDDFVVCYLVKFVCGNSWCHLSPTCRSTSAAIAPALRIEAISSDVLTKGRIEGPGSPESAYGGRVIALGTPLWG